MEFMEIEWRGKGKKEEQKRTRLSSQTFLYLRSRMVFACRPELQILGSRDSLRSRRFANSMSGCVIGAELSIRKKRWKERERTRSKDNPVARAKRGPVREGEGQGLSLRRYFRSIGVPRLEPRDFTLPFIPVISRHPPRFTFVFPALR